jgi:uncharacterized protein (DUF1697 family)
MIKVAGFLRGINVGGHHKVPMAELRNSLNEVGCHDVRTLLNTGNFVFSTKQTNIQELETNIEAFISKAFGFPIPVILKTNKEISDLVDHNPFININIHKDIRLYVSFLKDTPKLYLNLPYISADNSYKIIDVMDKTILSILDLSITKTPNGMDELEKMFGKNITTRNWKTINKLTDIL